MDLLWLVLKLDLMAYLVKIIWMVFKMELHPKSKEVRPYIYLTSCMKAKVTRAVYYELVNLGVDFKDGDNNLFGVWSSAHFFVLSVENSLASETER